MKHNSTFDQWIFQSYSQTAEGLGVFRILFAAFLLFFLIPGNGTPHFEFLSAIPNDFYNPPAGPLRFFEAYPSLLYFRLLRLTIILSVVALLLGFLTQKVSIVAGLAILLLQGGIFSVGKVNHEILVGLVPLVMAFSNWGATYSADQYGGQISDKKIETWPITLISLILAFMMFTAGFPKILGGWLDPSTQATQGHLMNQFFENGRQALLSSTAVKTDAPYFWELLDWATVIFETGFLFAVLKPRIFKIFVCFAVLFHFSTMLILNIAFLPNFAVYALFLNWSAIHDKMERFFSRGGNAKNYIYATVTGFSVLFFGGLKWLSLQDQVLQNSDLMLHEVVIVSLALFVVICVVLSGLLNQKSTAVSRG